MNVKYIKQIVVGIVLVILYFIFEKSCLRIGKIIFDVFEEEIKGISKEKNFIVIYRAFIDTALVIVLNLFLLFLAKYILRSDVKRTMLAGIILTPLFYELSFQRIACVGWFNENSIWFMPMRLHILMYMILLMYVYRKDLTLKKYTPALLSGVLYVSLMWIFY